MTSSYDEEALRHWLADYLVTNVGCSPYDIDFDAPMSDLGLGSRDAVVLSGELSELLGRKVSPVEFWQHPTIADLARFLTGTEAPAVESEVESHRSLLDEPIAVIGLGCRLPGGISGPEEYWQFLCEGRNAVTEVPPERWAPFDDGTPEVAAALAQTTRYGGYMDNLDEFDADFFDISSREAAKMDPQQRMLLEVAWEALEHAGIPPSSLRRSQTGVFAGACYTDYGYVAGIDLTNVDAWTNSGGALSIIANRLSYFLDFRGPSVTVDTACSSSIVALHLACQSLRVGDSDVALAAGVNLMLAPSVVRAFDQTGALSATGACHAFDADADGFIRGEGCGVVVLKRLGDAVRDGDRVMAVVRGSAVNQDGRSNGLLAPNPAAQMAVLRSAYANAGVAPKEVDYVEAHGTGTPLGDPIEARALGTVLGRGRAEDAPLLIGTAKTNLGHLEAAAGISGLIKTVLSVYLGSIPPNLHFHNPNPHIPFDQLRLKVVAEQTEWPQTGQPRRAGISSFGFGGTNAHAVIEQAPPAVPVIREADPAVTTLVLSGKSPERIASQAASLASWLQGAGAEVRLPDVAHTLSYHRERHAQFATVCVRDREQAVAALRALADGKVADGAGGIVGPHDGPCSPGTVFVFSGQGSHWAGMGRQLLADEPVFAEAIAELDPIFVEQVGFSLQKILAEGEAISGDAQVQPVLMGLQLALAELWRSYGVHPDAVIGHSMGEVTAAVVAGALSVVDGLRVIAIRSTLMSRMAGQGAVALLKLDPEATEALIADHADVSVAGYISPRETVIAGPVAPVDAVVAAVSAQNKFARRVNMEVASHTAFMDPILDELRAALADLDPEIPTIPFYSTVMEGFQSPMLDADYWVANVRQPALLSQAVAAAAEEHGTFIEVSAHPILMNAVGDTLDPASHHHSVGTLWRDGDDAVRFHTNLNTVHTSHPPQTAHPVEPHTVLPTTPWHHRKFWVSTRPINPIRTVADVADSRSAPTPVDGPIPVEWYLNLAWPVRESSGRKDDADASWLVISDSGLGDEIGRVLGDEFAATTEPTSLLAAGADPSAITDALAGVTHVLYAPAVTGDQFAFEAGYDLFNSARRLTAAIADMGVAPKLYLLTRNAQPVGDGDRANASQAVLWGLGRTLALEHPEFWGRVIDVDESVPDSLAASYVVDESQADDQEDQVVYRAGLRRVPRLQQSVAPASPPVELSSDSAYLVIGATGNIGPYLIQQLADSGAGTVVAVSRNPGSKLDELASRVGSVGTNLVTAAADAADESAMSAVFDRFGDDLPPLAGIYVAAFAGGPITLLEMTEDDVTAMFRPKLDVVSVLHRLSLRHKIDQFVLFSSISGLTGSRWLAHYTATTTFLDTFALARRAAGLPATAINWGLWKSLSDGQSEEERQVTLASGLAPMADDVAIKALPLLTGANAGSRPTVVAADWPLLAAAYRTRATLRIVDDLLTTVAAGADGPAALSTEFRDTLREADPARRRGILVDQVTAQVVSAMGLASAQLLDPTAGFFQSGMDSLMSVTLQRALSDSLGEALPASVVFDYPTVEALSDYLATLLPEVAEAAEDDSADEYDDFSDDELLKELSERLG